MNTVDVALLAVSRQELSNMAVVRAMAEYASWHVPMLFAADRLGKAVADQVTIISQEFGGQPRTFYMFTDRDALARAFNLPLGAFSGFCDGVAIFENVSATDFDEIQVNPGSPQELTFFIGSESYGLLALLTHVVRLERALAEASATQVPFAELRDHPGFMIAVRPPENQLATTAVNGLDGECAMVFTSPDRFELFSRKHAELATVTLPGGSLFQQLQRFGVSGVVINPDSPAPAILPAFLFPRVVAGA